MKSCFYSIIFVFFLLFINSLAFSYSKGEFIYSGYYFQDDDNSNTFDYMNDFNARLDVKDYLGQLGYKIRVASTIDTLNEARNRFIVEDMWLQYPLGNLSVKIGSQLINWSSMEVFRPSDIINSYYYDGNFAYPDKLGEPSLRLSYQFPTATFVFLYMPTFQKPVFPTAQNRFAGTLNYDEIKALNFDLNFLDNETINQYSVLFEFMWGSADINFNYTHHIDRRQPANVVNLNNGDFTAIYLPVDQYGFGYQFAYRNYLLKSELAYRDFKSTTMESYNSVSQLDHFQISLGTESTLYHPNNFESTLFIEYQKIEAVTESERASLGLFQNDIFFGYRLNLNDDASTELTSTFIFDIERYYEIIFNLSLSRKFLDRLIIDVGLNKFMAKSQDDIYGVINLANLDHSFFKLTYPL